MSNDRPHKGKHDEELVKMAEKGTRQELQEAIDEAVARDEERKKEGRR